MDSTPLPSRPISKLQVVSLFSSNVYTYTWNFLSTNQKHYQDLGTERHQYGISALVTQTSFCEGSSGDLVKRRLFSQANQQLSSTTLQ